MRNLEQYQKTFVSSEFEMVMADYRRKFLLERLEKYRPRRIVEIGCGMHSLFNHYKPLDLGQIIEPGDLFLKHAREQAEKNSKISVFHGTLEAFTSSTELRKFDFVVCSSLLHEISDADGFLKSLVKLCEKGAVVHVNVPNSQSLHRRLGQKLGVIQKLDELSSLNNQLEQSHVFSRSTLERKMISVGLKTLQMGSYFLKPFTHSQMAQLMHSGFLTPQLLDAFYDVSPEIGDLGAEIFIESQIQ